MNENGKKPNLIRAHEIAAQEQTGAHPWNPNSLMIGTRMSQLTGLERIGVNLVRLPPGKESCVPHTHCREEEWLFILSGKGKALIDGSEYEVGPGDFMGFPTPSVSHHLCNSGKEDLTYLVGGEHYEIEVAEFPAHGKRAIRLGDRMEIYDLAKARDFGPLNGQEADSQLPEVKE